MHMVDTIMHVRKRIKSWLPRQVSIYRVQWIRSSEASETRAQNRNLDFKKSAYPQGYISATKPSKLILSLEL